MDPILTIITPDGDTRNIRSDFLVKLFFLLNAKKCMNEYTVLLKWLCFNNILFSFCRLHLIQTHIHFESAFCLRRILLF